MGLLNMNDLSGLGQMTFVVPGVPAGAMTYATQARQAGMAARAANTIRSSSSWAGKPATIRGQRPLVVATTGKTSSLSYIRSMVGKAEEAARRAAAAAAAKAQAAATKAAIEFTAWESARRAQAAKEERDRQRRAFEEQRRAWDEEQKKRRYWKLYFATREGARAKRRIERYVGKPLHIR